METSLLWKRPLEAVILSNLLAQAGLPRAGCSALCPDEYLQHGRLQHLPGQLVPTCSPSHSFLMFRRKLLCFSLCSLLLFLNPTTRAVVTEGNIATTFSFKFQLFWPLLEMARNPQMRMQEHNILSTWFRARIYWGQRKWNYKIILLSAYSENKEENPLIPFFIFQCAFATFSVATPKYKKAFLSSVGGSIPEERKHTVKEQLAPQPHMFKQSKAMNLENMFNLKANLEKFNARTRNDYALTLSSS